MFNRFTRRALQVLFYARSQVSQLGSLAIEPEHILLGVLDEGNGLGCRILARTGVVLDDFRSDIVGLTGGEKVPEFDEIPFSASCKRALEYAAEEADRLLQNYIGTEHLLLGLLREERSVAAEVLAATGLRIEAVREAIVELLSRGEQPEPPGSAHTAAARRSGAGDHAGAARDTHAHCAATMKAKTRLQPLRTGVKFRWQA